MSDLPKLVQDDPWLTPYADHIRGRQTRLAETIAHVEHHAGSLMAHACGHHFTGIHRQPDGHWIIREWLPAALLASLLRLVVSW